MIGCSGAAESISFFNFAALSSRSINGFKVYLCCAFRVKLEDKVLNNNKKRRGKEFSFITIFKKSENHRNRFETLKQKIDDTLD